MTLDSQENRYWAKGLLMKCPFGSELPNCPIKELRKLPVRNRMALANSMSDEEIDSIIRHHKDCQKIRKAKESTEG